MTPEQRTQLERAGLALVGVLLLVVGFSAGRYSAPAQVETREVERWSVLDLTTEDITRGMTFALSTEKTVWRNVETRPDGTTVDRSIVHEATRQDSTATETAKRTEEHAGTREIEKVTITTLRPSWSAGVLVGATWKEPALPIAGPLVLGVMAEVRLGQTPFMLGAWGTTQGALGVSGRGEF